jgi:hemerythrin
MAFFEWDSRFNVGVDTIDNDHRRFVELINELHRAVQCEKGEEVLGEILTKVSVHLTAHFAVEEELMQKCQYPGYQDHMAEHALFAQHIRELRKEFESGNSSLTIETLN